MGARGRFCYQRLRRRREFASLTGVAADGFEDMVRRLRPTWEREVVAAKTKDGRPWPAFDSGGQRGRNPRAPARD